MPPATAPATGLEAGQTKTPHVTVVIPAYNAARYIAATLNSVLNQTFRDFEVIVVNDGSPDTADLERALDPYIARIRYIKQNNGGPSSARNTGIRQASGKYIAFLDSDDLWRPEHLENLTGALGRDPSLGLIYSNGVHIVNDRAFGIAFDRTPQKEPVTFESLVREECTVGTSSTVADRSEMMAAGLFDESLRRCEDYDLWLRMAHNGVRMTFTRKIQIYHRLANGLAADSDQMKSARLKVVEKVGTLANLTEGQRAVVQQRIRQLKFDLEFNRAKTFLLNERLAEARQAAKEAAKAASNWRLRLLQTGMYLFPRTLLFVYRAHLSRVANRKSAEHLRFMEGLGDLANVDFSPSETEAAKLAVPSELSAKTR
jgi:cellulose synthase/poly-beta-1,6-N-acetylglucosamine synthase-like glycosyltransferase